MLLMPFFAYPIGSNLAVTCKEGCGILLRVLSMAVLSWHANVLGRGFPQPRSLHSAAQAIAFLISPWSSTISLQLVAATPVFFYSKIPLSRHWTFQ